MLMVKPVSYLQTDARWKNIPYAVKGETSTIGGSGCGPTAMAMVLATWANENVTPKTECAWALQHGYKALHSGTYYGYFPPAAKRFGLVCKQLNGANIYGNKNSVYHDKALDCIKAGGLVIACMGKGNWTSSGHYVLVYDINPSTDTIYINDPASTLTRRTAGSYALFKQQVKYYWTIDAPRKEVEDLTKEETEALIKPVDEKVDKLTAAVEKLTETVEKLSKQPTNKQAHDIARKAEKYADTLPEPDWSKEEGHWKEATDCGVVDGTGPERYVKRDEVIAIIGRTLNKGE